MKPHPPINHYKFHPGYVAWILHRVTGLGLALYIFMHIYVIHHIAQGKEAFNEVMAIVQSPIFHLAEVALLGAVAYHAVNGIRVVLIDYGSAADKGPHKTWVLAVLGIAAVLTLAGGIPMLSLAFH
jgi:succinate dehydrogenase / fumarate reductase cytochrome b subunit